MVHRSRLTLALLLLSCNVAVCKDKKKAVLPPDVLRAHTVFVMIDRHAGIDIDEPDANNEARRNVENAFVKWGRLDPVADSNTADLIVVIYPSLRRIRPRGSTLPAEQEILTIPAAPRMANRPLQGLIRRPKLDRRRICLSSTADRRPIRSATRWIRLPSGDTTQKMVWPRREFPPSKNSVS
jgi:hypothetical protein